MFGFNSEARSDASKQDLKHQIKELKREAKRLSEQANPDHEVLGECFKELERCYRALADAESFPLLEDKYRSKAANWRKAADKKRVVEDSSLTAERTENSSTVPQEQAVNNNDDDGESVTMFEWEEPSIGFSDLGGREDVIARLRELVIEPVENKDVHEEYGVPVPNGIMFEGPPGTGKTTLAKALAGELDRQVLDISLADIRGSLAGESEQNLQRLFQQAIAQQPCVIIVDEVDAIVYDRTKASNGADMRQLITQFLADMPSLTGEDVLIVGSTNMQGDMDDAAKRPGRFGHRFEIDLPAKDGREAVLRVHLEDRPVATTNVDLREIARHTHGYSCADLEALVVEAARNAMHEETVIGQQHLLDAASNVTPSVDPSKW